MSSTNARRLTAADWICLAGAAFAVTTNLLGGAAVSAVAVGFAAWAVVPYAIVYFGVRAVVRDAAAVTGAAIAVLLGDALIRVSVFGFPSSSTAALALLFAPVYLSAIAIPLGLAIGWTAGAAWRRGVPGRIALGAVFLAVVAGGAIAMFHPTLLPVRLARVVSVRERIGRPRVVTGDGYLRRTRISDRPAFYLTGSFDGGERDQLAVVRDTAIAVLDLRTGAESSRAALSAESRRQLNWFSRLFRQGDSLLIAQTGGGFSDVSVLDLAGTTRWKFRPHADLPPIALLPRDLDGDGATEFYAASKGSVYRLDAEGRVVWTAAVDGLVDALDAGPFGDGNAVAAITSSRRVVILDAMGAALGTFTLPDREYRYALVGGLLIGGSSVVRALDRDGRTRFERELGDFRLATTVAVRLDAGGPAHLAVVAAAPRNVGLARMLVLTQRGDLVYDEILPGASTTLLAVADSATGRDVLLLSEATGLWAYRR